MFYVKYILGVLITVIICENLSAQIPVIEEPHHKTVLLNDYIRLIDVHLHPHDTTMYHIHAKPSVVVFISKSLMGTQDMSGNGLPSGEVLPGQTVFKDYAANPVTHRVYNSGNNVFHVMDIELVKKEPSADSGAALQQNNTETTINEKLVRVYKFNVSDQQAFTLQKNNCAHLLICISGEINAAKQKIKTGEFMFYNPGSTITLRSVGNTSTCVLLELK